MHSTILAILAFSSLFTATSQAFAQEQVVLEASSNEGTFTVEITWTAAEIGSAHAFDIRFIEPETGEEIEDVIYDFSIYDGEEREVLRRDQTATRQEFTFEETGPYEIRIDDIEGLGEGVVVPIQVTPEFSVGLFVLIAVILGATVLVIRHNSNNLFRQ